MNDTTNARGLGSNELRVFDLRTTDGHFDQEDKFLLGRVGFSAVIVGLDPS
jgi:hypothetical protein